MPIVPRRITDADVLDRLREPAFYLDRDGQPQQTVLGFDLIAIPPVALRELRVVVQNEFVDLAHQIEVALPRDVRRLQDGDTLHDRASFRSSTFCKSVCMR